MSVYIDFMSFLQKLDLATVNHFGTYGIWKIWKDNRKLSFEINNANYNNLMMIKYYQPTTMIICAVDSLKIGLLVFRSA